MTRDPIRTKDAQFPERILQKLLNDYIEGRLGSQAPILKAAVVSIDTIGGQLAGPGTDRDEEPANPRNSVVGRIITDATDRYTPDIQLPVFWPLNPHDSMPIKEGEHIYVLFEDVEQTHGFWFARISEPHGINNLNYTPGTKRYTENNDDLRESTSAVEKIVQDTESMPEVKTPSPTFKVETEVVPEFNQRPGDRILHGSNNTTIVMSRDRVDTADSGLTDEAGSIDIIAGRAGEDIDLENDSARVYISMKSNADENFNIPGNSVSDSSFVVAKADEVRLVAREGFKVAVENGDTQILISDGNVDIKTSNDVNIDSKNMNVKASDNIVLDAGGDISVGTKNAVSPLVRGDKLKLYLDQVFTILSTMIVDVAGIPGIGVANSSVQSAVKNLDTMWENTVPSKNNKVE